jgi:hypothetical protein
MESLLLLLITLLLGSGSPNSQVQKGQVTTNGAPMEAGGPYPFPYRSPN